MLNGKILIFIFFILIFLNLEPSYGIQEENLTWAGGDVYTMTPSSNMVTEGNYTIKVIDFPAPVRGRLSVNDTIIPDTPVVLAVTVELYKDIINNSNPIATFTIKPGDEFISSQQDLRITINNMPSSDSSDWVYESYNPSVDIRLQQAAIPNMDINIKFTDTNDNEIDIINPGETFLVNISIQNSGEDVADDLTYNIIPDNRLMSTFYTNKLKDTISQLREDEQIAETMRLVAPDSLGLVTYEIDVNVTAKDSRDVVHFWNSSGFIDANGSLDLLGLDKDIGKSTIYLQENVHVIISIRNRGTLPIKNIEIKDPIPDNFIYIQDDVDLSNLTQVSLKRDSLEAEQTWTYDYFLKPLMPGIYVLPAYIVNFTMNGVKFTNNSNEVGFRVYGPIIQLNKSVINQGNNIMNIYVSANNIGNGPATVVINDRLPNDSKMLSGNNHTTIFVDANEEKGFNYTIYFSGNIKDIPPANATYYLGDYKFMTSSLENVIKSKPPQINTTNVNITVPVPTIQEIEREVVGTIPPEGERSNNTEKSPEFNFVTIIIFVIIIVFLATILFIKARKK